MLRIEIMDCGFHWIDSDLALGGSVQPEMLSILAVTHGIRRIVDVRAEACDDEKLLSKFQIQLLHLPAADFYGLSLAQITRGVSWINEAAELGEKTLVHCEHGIGRSSLLVGCVLVSRGVEPDLVLNHLQQRRSQVAWSAYQVKSFEDWVKNWQMQRLLTLKSGNL